ncbi:carboxylate--amine ligase [Ornithinimicrobium avium]|uniref:Carboxylate--amine ligase n=1 Tax=Ornithinimicrobium avium TaxID=2283195 RepID=A0A345NMK1_9MICO|nr:carboxylate--amine ligase [Ornithinimicrobium avium]AXH96259.1 carboxylate--amine ligase [Ornithinimicrobium avium]
MSLPDPSARFASTVPFVPVVLGGELATYTLARAFHAELGVRTTVVTRGVPSAVRGSAIIDNVRCPGMDEDEELLACLRRVADERPDHRVLLLGTVDVWVDRIAGLRDRLDERFVVPYPSGALIDRLSDKEGFAALCAELGVAHPVTRAVPADAPEEAVAQLLEGLRPPFVVKAGDSVAFGALLYQGKQKVAYCADLEELLALRRTMTAAGYAGGLVVQERIPGGDEQMRVLTTYSDREGSVRWGRLGHVLLEDHDPAMIGNPLAVVHGTSGTAVAEAARLMEHVGWTGYANFDIKVDPRDGTEYFFELNPRLGRSHAYLTAAGHPVVTPLVREYVEGRDPFDDVRTGPETDDWLYSIVPVPLLRRYVTDPSTRERLTRIRRSGRVLRPLRYAVDGGRERVLAQLKNDVLYTKNFATHYRRPVTS